MSVSNGTCLLCLSAHLPTFQRDGYSSWAGGFYISNTPFPYGFHYFLFRVGNNKCIHQETIVLSQTYAL